MARGCPLSDGCYHALCCNTEGQQSFLRARAADHVFRTAGVDATPRTAYVRVYVNEAYLGLYIASEEVTAAGVATKAVEGYQPNWKVRCSCLYSNCRVLCLSCANFLHAWVPLHAVAVNPKCMSM
jgi:hypothetical protein